MTPIKDHRMPRLPRFSFTKGLLSLVVSLAGLSLMLTKAPDIIIAAGIMVGFVSFAMVYGYWTGQMED